MLPMLGVVWLDTPESTTQSVKNRGEVIALVLKELARDCMSH
jgi:hypothetical protein